MMRFAALLSTIFVVGFGKMAWPKPVSPWVSSATESVFTKGSVAPIATGTSLMPRSSTSLRALVVHFSTVVLP